MIKVNEGRRGSCPPLHDSNVLKAATVIRRLHGGSQSVMLRASDGSLHVVKMMGGPSGPNVLANEVLGNELARHIGLTVPEWNRIELSDEFLDRNPECWFESAIGLVRPQSGLHFASRMVGQEEENALFEILPSAWLSRICNRNEFIGMLALDLWGNHNDNRQAVFVKGSECGVLTAAFIDNGHMFGGPMGCEEYRPGRAPYLDVRVYAALGSNQTLGRFLKKILSIDASTLRDLARAIPCEWRTKGYVERVVALLLSRQRTLGLIVQAELQIISRLAAKHNALQEA